MTRQFRPATGQALIEVAGDVLIPITLGVGILRRPSDEDGSATLAVCLVGQYPDIDAKVEVKVAVDTDNAIGLIVQLQLMLAEAGVPAEELRNLTNQAHLQIAAVLAQDHEPSWLPVDPYDPGAAAMPVDRDDGVDRLPQDDGPVPAVPPDADLPVVELDPGGDQAHT